MPIGGGILPASGTNQYNELNARLGDLIFAVEVKS